jgi:succinate dehydrogenase / fumarate reductase cytochrome b subunit
MLGGLRYLLWDQRIGIDKGTASRLAWANVIASVALTILVWIVVFAVR